MIRFRPLLALLALALLLDAGAARSATPPEAWLDVVNARLFGEQLQWVDFGGDLSAENLANGLDLSLGAEGAVVWSGPRDEGFTLRVARWGGSADRLEADNGAFSLVGCASSGLVGVQGDCLRRAQRDHGGLIEGWENHEDGFEQTFEVGELPEGDRLFVDLVVEGATVEGSGTDVVLRRPGGSRLLYGDLAVWDARGRSLPARMVGEGGALRILVDTSGAVAPVTIDPLLAGASESWAGTNSYDQLGRVVRLGDVNADGYADVIIGAPSATAGTQSGAVYVYAGDTTGPSATPSVSLSSGVADDRFGASITIADLDSDGVDDVLVGAYQSDSTVSTSRSVYWFRGASTGLQTSARGRLAAQDYDFGYTVANVGDVYGDGHDDFAVSAPHDPVNSGTVYVYDADGSTFPTAPTTTIPGVLLDGESGLALAGGDFNGDGYSDVAVSTTGASSDAGEVDIYEGGAGVLATDYLILASPVASAQFGSALAVADVNGDGYDDLYVGAPYASASASNAGAVYLFEGSASGLGTAPARTWNGTSASVRLGTAIAADGDLEGDGFPDLILGAPGASGSAGRIYVDEGTAAGPDGTIDQSVDAPSGAKQFGFALDLGGDVDGDGHDDLVVGTPYSNTQAGEAWLYTGYRDDDEDGYQAEEDCDDTDAAIHPGGTEHCDGVDENCDGVVDNNSVDASTFYRDEDVDGFGTTETEVHACASPLGFVADSTDCDDGNTLVHPGAAEVCNGWDDDCEGSVDEGAVDAPTWYADVDTDGYGELTSATPSCSAPAGTVADSTDCDDLIAAVHPGADETCNDRDDDCDGSLDEDPIDPSMWFGDADGDSFGDAAVAQAACDQPAGTVADATDCDDTTAAVSPLGTEICNGVDDDCSAVIDDHPTDAPAWYLDADGDGYGLDGVVYDGASCGQPEGYSGIIGDCDDARSDVSPVGTEHCDGADEDCSGVVDDAAVDAPAWYPDLDGDGYGAGDSVRECAAPDGYVSDATDCDDAAGGVYPGAAEVCDEVDQDCDAVVDEEPVDGTALFLDADGDGFGDPAAPLFVCGKPAGTSVDGTDCDDSAAGVYPGAVERCDEVDEDCDQLVDEEAVDMTGWYLDTDGDGFGDPATELDACVQPDGYVRDATDCDDTDPSVGACPEEQVDSGESDEPLTGEPGKSGCGCATGGPSGASFGWLGSLVALAAARRRSSR